MNEQFRDMHDQSRLAQVLAGYAMGLGAACNLSTRRTCAMGRPSFSAMLSSDSPSRFMRRIMVVWVLLSAGAIVGAAW